MSAERKPGDYPDVERLVITDSDGDVLAVDRYPSGGVIFAASHYDEDGGATVPVRVTIADLPALVAFLTGGAA